MHIKYLYILLGGGIGALLRYGVSSLPPRYVDSVFPYGTLAANFIGALVIGFVWGLTEQVTVSPNTRVFLMTGVLGGFTTFSTYSLETFSLLRDNQVGWAVTNVLASNIGCIALVFAGYFISKVIVSAVK